LWLYATVEGVGSARATERLTQQHDAYRWICGGVSVNHHSLLDFRVQSVEFLDGLLTQRVAVLMAQGLVKLQRVALGIVEASQRRRRGTVPSGQGAATRRAPEVCDR
jgi:transposase